MAEYIDRKKAIEFAKQNTPNLDGETTIKCVERALKNVPTADVVEVVRCKDCKLYDMRNAKCLLNSEEADQYSRGYDFEMYANDFCSYGVKRSEGK